jgi:catechol 2,3-dioxygenase-like lactoylglutathione lyase family enzyme
MANNFGTDILIQAPDPRKAALFYVEHLGFEITDDNPKMIGLHGKHINLFIEQGANARSCFGGNGGQCGKGQGAARKEWL